jgi:hypothetical protein
MPLLRVDADNQARQDGDHGALLHDVQADGRTHSSHDIEATESDEVRASVALPSARGLGEERRIREYSRRRRGDPRRAGPRQRLDEEHAATPIGLVTCSVRSPPRWKVP